MRIRAALLMFTILATLATACGSSSKQSADNNSSMSAESAERSSTTTSTAVVSPTTSSAPNNNASPSTTSAPPTSAAAPAPIADLAPVIILAGCRVGRVMNVRTAVQGSSAANKWGVVAVEVTRVSNEGAQVSQALQWLGAGFGAGDEWSATIPGGAGWANTVTVMATTFTNKTTRQQVSLVGTPC